MSQQILTADRVVKANTPTDYVNDLDKINTNFTELYDPIGLTSATQTVAKVLESVTLVNTASPITTIATLTGAGVVSRIGLIVGFTSSIVARALKDVIFNVYIDGETQPSLVFDGDLFGCSGLQQRIPQVNSPFVWESDHLALLFGSDAVGGREMQLQFKFPIPFSTGCIVKLQIPAGSGMTTGNYFTSVEAQMGINSSRRLKSAYSYGGTANAWSVGTSYSVGTFVTFTDGNVYNCIAGALGSGQAPGNAAFWTLIGKGLQNIPSAPIWSSSVSYSTGALATQGTTLFQASQAASGAGQSPSNASFWAAVDPIANPNFNTGWNLLSVNQPCWLASFNFGAQGVTGTNSVTFLESNLAVYDGNLTPSPSFPNSSPTPSFASSGTEDFMGASFYWTTLGSSQSSSTLSPGADYPATALTITSISSDGTTVTLTVPTMGSALRPSPPFGSTITVSGVSIAGYNGTFTVTAVTPTTIAYANTTTGVATGGIVNLPAVIPLHGKVGSIRDGYATAISSAFLLAANVDLIAHLNGGLRCGTNCLLRWEGGPLAAGTGPIVPNTTWKINPTVLYYI